MKRKAEGKQLLRGLMGKRRGISTEIFMLHILLKMPVAHSFMIAPPVRGRELREEVWPKKTEMQQYSNTGTCPFQNKQPNCYCIWQL